MHHGRAWLSSRKFRASQERDGKWKEPIGVSPFDASNRNRCRFMDAFAVDVDYFRVCVGSLGINVVGWDFMPNKGDSGKT